MTKIIYEPFKTLKEQEVFERALKDEIEQCISESFEEGTKEDIKEGERKEQLNNIVKSRLEERLINLNK